MRDRLHTALASDNAAARQAERLRSLWFGVACVALLLAGLVGLALVRCGGAW